MRGSTGKSWTRFVTTLFVLCAVCCGTPAAAQPSSTAAVLIVAFGTSVEKARVSYANVERQVKKALPGREVRWAWTANSLLGTSSGKKPVLSTQEALAKLAAEGTKDVSILSLHIIPGAEYNDLLRTAAAFEGLPKGLRRVRLAPPLLYGTDSLKSVSRLLVRSVPAERKKDEAVLFVGHGTHHASGVYYPALQYYLHTLDKNAFVGTVEGDLDFEVVLKSLQDAGARKVWMAPLMTVAGDHAANDLFGAGEESWRQRFIANGIQVRAIAKGLGEDPAFVAQWLEGLKKLSDRDAR
ncbi:MAG: sirohydrochlorin cobaltochelatase [Desulfovibrio sp.]|jgi:sirohydrochlorin cobaltochelatase|nr:sirohydrochlorin cobaltochelatase [Desulfovibrio sp.]